MGGQKKLYNRWKSITEKTRLMNECKQITSMFQTLNFAIKSVADLAFIDNNLFKGPTRDIFYFR